MIAALIACLLNGDDIPLVFGKKFMQACLFESGPVGPVFGILFGFIIIVAVSRESVSSDCRHLEHERIASGCLDDAWEEIRNALREAVSDHKNFEFFFMRLSGHGNLLNLKCFI